MGVHTRGPRGTCLLDAFSVEEAPCGVPPVNDIVASEDILGEIILYKTLSGNIFVYFIMSALYI